MSKGYRDMGLWFPLAPALEAVYFHLKSWGRMIKFSNILQKTNQKDKQNLFPSSTIYPGVM